MKYEGDEERIKDQGDIKKSEFPGLSIPDGDQIQLELEEIGEKMGREGKEGLVDNNNDKDNDDRMEREKEKEDSRQKEQERERKKEKRSKRSTERHEHRHREKEHRRDD